MFDRPLDLFPVALKEGLHTAVRKVSHPASETELCRDIARERAVENALYSSLDHEIGPCKLHKIIIAKKASKGYESSLMKTFRQTP